MTEILEQLELNQTLFIQFALFAACFFILSQVFLKPFQALIEKRNHKLKNEVQGANELLKSVEAKIADYEKTLQALRAEARVSYEGAVSEVRTREDAALASHRDTLKKDYQNISQQLNSEKTKIESELKAQAATLADGIVDKLLATK